MAVKTKKSSKKSAPKTKAKRKMSPVAKRALAKKGKIITSKAKEIRKSSPKMKWTSAMKAAGKALKGKL
jgi:hypothetical protein